MKTADGSLAARIAQVRAALAEGFCPQGHKLTHGGGRWGSCGTCRTMWTVTVPGYTYRSHGPTDCSTHVTERGEFLTFEPPMEYQHIGR